MKNKIHLCLILSLIVFISFGCSKMNKSNLDKVLFYNASINTGEKINDTPILEISDNNELISFENLIDSASKTEGVLTAMSDDSNTSIFIAEIYKENFTEELSFLVDSDGAFGLNKDTNTGLEFKKEDLKKFFNLYKDTLN